MPIRPTCILGGLLLGLRLGRVPSQDAHRCSWLLASIFGFWEPVRPLCSNFWLPLCKIVRVSNNKQCMTIVITCKNANAKATCRLIAKPVTKILTCFQRLTSFCADRRQRWCEWRARRLVHRRPADLGSAWQSGRRHLRRPACQRLYLLLLSYVAAAAAAVLSLCVDDSLLR